MENNEFWGTKIKDWNEKEFPNIVDRKLEIPSEIKINRVISLVGPRRVGKTYELLFLSKQISERYGKEHTLYLNFEMPNFGVLNEQDLAEMLKIKKELNPNIKSNKLWLFLDEVQNVLNWEKFVRACLDEGINVFISGSSSKLLSKEIATSMRGRNLSYNILPLSFKEFLDFNNFKKQKFYSSKEKSQLLNYLRKYLYWGGYPERVLFSFEKERILIDIFDTAILRDVLERNNIRNDVLLKNLVKALLTAKEFSVNKFYNHLKSQGISVSKNTLYNYLHYLEDAFFVFTLNKFSLSYKKEEQSLPKIYFIDNGLLYNNGIDDKGRLFENLVFVELKRRRLDIAYYQDATQKEVDFVVKKGKKVKKLIQACYDVSNYQTLDREINSIISAGKKFNCKNLLILNWNEEKTITKKGMKIKFIPLWKWLLKTPINEKS